MMKNSCNIEEIEEAEDLNELRKCDDESERTENEDEDEDEDEFEYEEDDESEEEILEKADDALVGELLR